MKTPGIVFIILILALLSGCAPLIIGGAVGVVGGYAVSRDTIQGETDTDYARLWNSAVTVLKMRGTVTAEDEIRGLLDARVGSSRVYIRLFRLTKATTRLKVSARKYLFPNLTLAQDIFVKIMEEARR